MGGSVRKDMSFRITHLIAKEGVGDKYYYALTFRVPVVMDSWVYQAWENKHIVGFQASDSDFIIQHRLKPFEGTKVCFLGFPEEEKSHMIEILQENGGVSTNLADNTATHIVLKNEGTYGMIKNISSQDPFNVNFTDTSTDDHLTLPAIGFNEKSNVFQNTTPVIKKSSFQHRSRKIINKHFVPSYETKKDCVFLFPSFTSISDEKASEPYTTDEIANDKFLKCANVSLRMKNDEKSYDQNSFSEMNGSLRKRRSSNIIKTDRNQHFGLRNEKISICSLLNDHTEDQSLPGSIDDVTTVKSGTLKFPKQLASHFSNDLFGNNASSVNCNNDCFCNEDGNSGSVHLILKKNAVVPDSDDVIPESKTSSNFNSKEFVESKEIFNEKTYATECNAEIKFKFKIPSPEFETINNGSADLLKNDALNSELTERCDHIESLQFPIKRRHSVISVDNETASNDYRNTKKVSTAIEEFQLSIDQDHVQTDVSAVSEADGFSTDDFAILDGQLLTVPNGLSVMTNSELVCYDDKNRTSTNNFNCTVADDEDREKNIIDEEMEIDQFSCGTGTNVDISRKFIKVIDESVVSAVPPLQSHRTYVVKANWFWASVQNEGREKESNYVFEDAENTMCLQNSTPLSSNSRARKRKRLRSRFPSSNDLSAGQLAQKRRSSTSDATRLSDGSILDYTASPDIADNIESPIKEKPKNADKRYHRFLELCQTESNYVNILNTIMTLFKAALDEKVDTDSQLLNATELKIIFGNLPPIYHIHKSMLEELKQLASQWKETTSIGTLFLKYSDELVKAYIPFINFFENTRDMLIKCDKTKPRFHAFLKICQMNPECGRETLQDLLIRPVQRLPSITLLLNDILRHTPKNNPDYRVLESAIASMEQVMTKMNENKRRTDGQVALFDIFNDIDNCPVHLVSSQRCFLNRCEVTELSDNLNGRGSPLVLFTFSDVLEVCKKRMKAFNALKSPKDNSSTKTTNCKLYKHIKLLSLSSIKRVVDINETEDCHNVFALMINDDESKEEFYSFKITDDCVSKVQYLKFLCKQIATNTCRTDAENYLATFDARELDITSSDVISGGTLGRAFNKFAAKTKLKVGRALSFNKTPNKLKRAVSTMMSPFANHNQLTPSTELASLQLAPFNVLPVKFWK